MLTGTTTGPGGAFPGLGQAGAGNARATAQGLSPPVGRSFATERSAASQEAWPDAAPAGRKAQRQEPQVERRQASAPRRISCAHSLRTRACAACAAPERRGGFGTRLPAFRLPFFRFVGLAVRRPDESQRVRPEVAGPMTNSAKSGIGLDALVSSRMGRRSSSGRLGAGWGPDPLAASGPQRSYQNSARGMRRRDGSLLRQSESP